MSHVPVCTAANQHNGDRRAARPRLPCDPSRASSVQQLRPVFPGPCARPEPSRKPIVPLQCGADWFAARLEVDPPPKRMHWTTATSVCPVVAMEAPGGVGGGGAREREREGEGEREHTSAPVSEWWHGCCSVRDGGHTRSLCVWWLVVVVGGAGLKPGWPRVYFAKGFLRSCLGAAQCHSTESVVDLEGDEGTRGGRASTPSAWHVQDSWQLHIDMGTWRPGQPQSGRAAQCRHAHPSRFCHAAGASQPRRTAGTWPTQTCPCRGPRNVAGSQRLCRPPSRTCGRRRRMHQLTVSVHLLPRLLLSRVPQTMKQANHWAPAK